MRQQVFGEGGDDLFRVATSFEVPQPRGALLPPLGKHGVHACDEGDELRVLVDGGLDGGLVHGEVEVTGAIRLEQDLPELRADGPGALEGIDIVGGNTALQVPLDILEVFRRLAVDVARKVEVEIVLLDLLEGNHARVFRGFEPLLISTIRRDVLGA